MPSQLFFTKTSSNKNDAQQILDEEHYFLAEHLSENTKKIVKAQDNSIKRYFIRLGNEDQDKSRNTDENQNEDEVQWLELESNKLGEGSFGKVYAAKTILTFKEDNIIKKTVDKVAKIQQRFKKNKDQIERLKKEATYLNKHGISSQILVASKKIIIVMDNCGNDLEKVLESFSACRASFAKRYLLLLAIINELLILKKNGIVHADIKPENFCCKSLQNGFFQVILIDFGMAVEQNNHRNFFGGSLRYMAPELFEYEKHTFSSDLYAFAAIAGVILGAKNIFKFKESESECLINKGFTERVAWQKSRKKPLNFDGIFEDYDVCGVGDALKENILLLLKKASDVNPRSRKTIEFIAKIFNNIPYIIEASHLEKEYACLSFKDELFDSNPGIEQGIIPKISLLFLLFKNYFVSDSVNSDQGGGQKISSLFNEDLKKIIESNCCSIDKLDEMIFCLKANIESLKQRIQHRKIMFTEIFKRCNYLDLVNQEKYQTLVSKANHTMHLVNVLDNHDRKIKKTAKHIHTAVVNVEECYPQKTWHHYTA